MLTVSDDADGDGIDRHPERRVKAAYNAFEEARLSILKAENPSLRLTQLKQKIFEEWKKSPDNPMNKDKVAAYNSKQIILYERQSKSSSNIMIMPKNIMDE